MSFAFLCKLSSSRLNKSNSNCILFISSFHSFISCPSQLYLRRLFKKNRIILLHSTLQRGGSLPVSEVEERVRIIQVRCTFADLLASPLLHTGFTSWKRSRYRTDMFYFSTSFHIYETLIPPRWIRRNLLISYLLNRW